MWATVVPAASLLATPTHVQRSRAIPGSRYRSCSMEANAGCPPTSTPPCATSSSWPRRGRHRTCRVAGEPRRATAHQRGRPQTAATTAPGERRDIVAGSTDRLGTAPSSSSHMRELLDHLDVVVVAAIVPRPTAAMTSPSDSAQDARRPRRTRGSSYRGRSSATPTKVVELLTQLGDVGDRHRLRLESPGSRRRHATRSRPERRGRWLRAQRHQHRSAADEPQLQLEALALIAFDQDLQPFR